MKVIGITGNTASGKSLFSRIFKQCFYCKIFNADAIVHTLYINDTSVMGQINQIVPDSLENGVVNRKILLSAILKDYSLLEKIEDIVHPVVYNKLCKFLKFSRRNKENFVLLDIPLLFKIKANLLCSSIVRIDTNRVIINQRLRQRLYCRIGLLHQNVHKRTSILKKNFFYIKSGIDKYNLYKYAYKLVFN